MVEQIIQKPQTSNSASKFSWKDCVLSSTVLLGYLSHNGINFHALLPCSLAVFNNQVMKRTQCQ